MDEKLKNIITFLGAQFCYIITMVCLHVSILYHSPNRRQVCIKSWILLEIHESRPKGFSVFGDLEGFFLSFLNQVTQLFPTEA